MLARKVLAPVGDYSVKRQKIFSKAITVVPNMTPTATTKET